jgi:hypothetical protein
MRDISIGLAGAKVCILHRSDIAERAKDED